MKSLKNSSPAGTTLAPEDYQAMAAFRYGVRHYLAFAETGARSVGLTTQQHQALLAIKAQTTTRPMSIGDLAAQLLVKHHSAVELVGRLEKAGFTQRSADLLDRRKVLVTLTPALCRRNLNELRVIAPAFSGLLAQLEALERKRAADADPG